MFRRSKKVDSQPRIVVRGGRPQAFSYRANRSDQEYNLGRLQPREQDKRKRGLVLRYWRQRIGAVIAGLVIIFCILDILHLSSTPKVIALTTPSNSYFLQPATVYQTAASKLFKGSIFNANKITINSDVIASKLQKEFPELSAVSVTLPLMGHRPIVYIAPTNPSLILATEHNGSFVLDNNGKALIQTAQANDLSGLKLPVVTDESGITIRTGQVALTSNSISFIQIVAQEMAAKGVTVASYTLPAAAYELDVHPSGVGYYVKFNMYETDALQQVGTFLAVKQRLSSQNITPSSYIDVRVDGRAYYK